MSQNWPVAREDVYAAIDSERDYQEAMWGATLSADRPATDDEPGGHRSIDEFSLYIVGYANDLLVQGSHFCADTAKLDIIRKIATLCVHTMEQHGAPIRVFNPDNLRSRFGPE